jgi:hypothetical protein
VNTAFYVVSTLFVVALAGLAFTAVRWAVGRDRAARAASDRGADVTGRPPTDLPGRSGP